MGQLKNFMFIALFGALITYSAFALAQAVPSPAPSLAPLAAAISAPSSDDFSSLLKGIGELKALGPWH